LFCINLVWQLWLYCLQNSSDMEEMKNFIRCKKTFQPEIKYLHYYLQQGGYVLPRFIVPRISRSTPRYSKYGWIFLKLFLCLYNSEPISNVINKYCDKWFCQKYITVCIENFVSNLIDKRIFSSFCTLSTLVSQCATSYSFLKTAEKLAKLGWTIVLLQIFFSQYTPCIRWCLSNHKGQLHYITSNLKWKMPKHFSHLTDTLKFRIEICCGKDAKNKWDFSLVLYIVSPKKETPYSYPCLHHIISINFKNSFTGALSW